MRNGATAHMDGAVKVNDSEEYRMKPVRLFYVLTLLGISLSLSVHGQEGEPPSSATSTLETSLARLNDVITDRPSPQHHLRAEVLFRLGRFKEAIADYDVAAALGSPHDEYSCWERGLAQYYAGDFAAGAAQFARYHEVGATDIENGLWRLMCIAEEKGLKAARESMFAYPSRRRPPFPALLDLYLDTGDADAVFEATQAEGLSPSEQTNRRFYAHYYVGKYYELMGQRDKARTEMAKALKQPLRHFMYFCAEADAKRLAETSETPEPAIE